VVHERERLALRLEPGDDLLRLHPRLDELQGRFALDWLEPLRTPHLAHSSVAEEAKEPV
jgi:hypothetical protein